MKFSVLIPTYNRPADLIACIDSIAMQDERPAQCVIVDDGELSSDELARMRGLLGEIALTYYRKDHTKEWRGQSESKNIGLLLAEHDIVFILDDDILLEQGFFSSVMRVWATQDGDKLMGVGGVITNLRSRSRLEKLFNLVFLLRGDCEWDITPVGFQVWDERLESPQRCYYVHGGLCSLRKSRAIQIPFSTFKAGRSFLEDVEFCMRAKKADLYFIMEPGARALHNTSPLSREGQFAAGVKESASRKEIFRNNADQRFRFRVWFAWSSIGWVLRQFLAGNFVKGAGMFVGFVK